MRLSFGASDKAVLSALGQSLAIIEFDPQGTILTANPNFLAAMGYELAEIKGQHHRIFVDSAEAQGRDYRAFWDKLGRGEHFAQEFRRLGKGGREVWIQASYNPARNRAGKVIKVVKQATDITVEKQRRIEADAKLKALSRAQAVIEFTPAGEILTANDNFLEALGYNLAEIKGRHHRMFVEPALAESPEYQAFWARLNAGEVMAAEFKRIGKGGREVWIQASYNPVFSPTGKVMKVVKFATDVTTRVHAVQTIAKALRQLAENDLTHRIEAALDPAYDQLRLDLNASMDHLQTALQQVNTCTGAIESGVREIATASDDLARRTEQQAASLEETAAALDEITATVKTTAEGAVHAKEAVSKTKTDAERSGAVVKRAVSAMGGIESSSQKVSQIIGVIDEIAFQTNLLALNAGVEAARAGEAGRGFAVVASEVRALAQRSAEAAKEIKSLISASEQHVAEGVKLVRETGDALERIVDQVADVNAIVADITTSTREQATALEEVNSAVNQMDQVTQQNAAMVEQATAASHGLRSEAEELARQVATFSLGNAIERRPSRSAERAPVVSHTIRTAQARTAMRGAAAAAATSLVAHEGWEEF